MAFFNFPVYLFFYFKLPCLLIFLFFPSLYKETRLEHILLSTFFSKRQQQQQDGPK